MLIARDNRQLQMNFNLFAEEGRKYGLERNMAKTKQHWVRSEEDIVGCDGQSVQCCDSIVYLGGILSSDGQPTSEASRRIGKAKGAFGQTFRAWRHANISRARKKELLDAPVVLKLLYGLESLLLVTSDRNKLDGFHCQCLRRIHNIAHPYVSRVSNDAAFAQARAQRPSAILQERQGNLYENFAKMGPRSWVRKILLEEQAVSPKDF